MFHISANNINRKLIRVSMSMFPGSLNPNMAIVLCQVLFFNMDATFYVLLLHYLITACFFTLRSYLIRVSSNDTALVHMRLFFLIGIPFILRMINQCNFSYTSMCNLPFQSECTHLQCYCAMHSILHIPECNNAFTLHVLQRIICWEFIGKCVAK